MKQIGVILDMSLTYREQLLAVGDELRTGNNEIQKSANSSSSADAGTLETLP